jgi:DNA-binding NarL/FixJ family response regulator
MGGDRLPGGANERASVLVADDHPVVRIGLAAVLTQEPDLLLAAQAENGERAVAHVSRALIRCGVDKLADAGDGRSGGDQDDYNGVWEARILALTYEGDADIRRALKAGGCGYLLKDMLLPEVIAAIRAVRRSERPSGLSG